MRALRLLKYLNCLHELRFTAAAAAATVDGVDEHIADPKYSN